mgnify:CR=1 FL=1
MRKIIVVGSGVIGLSCAFLLALEGYSVKVITRNPEEATSWVAGGMLAPFSEGLEGKLFDFSYMSLKAYPEFVSRLEEVSKQRIDFWQEGILRVVLEGEEELIKKAEDYKSKGYSVSFFEPAKNLSPEVKSLVLYGEEAWVDAEMLMDAFLFAMQRLGVEMVIDEVVKLERREDHIEALRGLKERYVADFYLFSTGAWTKELFDLPVFPVKGQALKLKHVSLPKVHYSSVSYLIPRSRYLYVGATSEEGDFSRCNTLEGLHRLASGALRVAPFLARAELISSLYGFRPATPDELPIFETGENYMLLTGHHRNGILHAPLTARLAVDYISRDIRSSFFEVFGSRRFSS